MKNFKILRALTLLIALSLFIFPQSTYAYINPGTGSYIIQVIIAALVGGLFVIKIFWNKVKKLFHDLVIKNKKHKNVPN